MTVYLIYGAQGIRAIGVGRVKKIDDCNGKLPPPSAGAQTFVVVEKVGLQPPLGTRVWLCV